MKNLLFFFLTFLILNSCQKENTTKNSIALKIAHAHGFKNWDNVTSFAFTFGGDIKTPNSGRAWIWKPKTDDIQLIYKEDTINFNRNKLDSTSIKYDKAFINDKFWALIPFQLVWDSKAIISTPVLEKSPIKGDKLNRITIVYPNLGGYTPGDAYDIFYSDDFIIREWNYRKVNDPEPSLTNTFEDYKDFGSIKIAQSHKQKGGQWNLLLRDINIEFED